MRQYEGESISTVGQVVVSDDPEAFLAQLSTMSAFNDLQAQLFDDYATEAEALEIRQRRHREARRRGRRDREAARRGEGDVDDKLAEAKDLLGRPQGRGARGSCSRAASSALPSDVPASGRAAAAVQLRDGPGRRRLRLRRRRPERLRLLRPDDDGLGPGRRRPAALLQRPVSAPARTSPPSDLQPGDLVFYYSPISHVGMYIGNGMIVHAANPGTGVAVSGLYSMPYVGAVRPG